MGKLVILDKEEDIKGMMVTDDNGNLISLQNFEVPKNCVVLFVDKDAWAVQSK